MRTTVALIRPVAWMFSSRRPPPARDFLQGATRPYVKMRRHHVTRRPGDWDTANASSPSTGRPIPWHAAGTPEPLKCCRLRDKDRREQDDLHHHHDGLHALKTQSNPLSVTATGSISKTTAAGGHAAIYGAGGAATNWTITNSGRVAGTGASLFGIDLGYFGPPSARSLSTTWAGRSRDNGPDHHRRPNENHQPSGGTLSANGNDIVFLQTPGTIVNYGLAINTNATGFYLQGGGVVVNGATGTISINTAVSGIDG